ncbi:VanW family protein [Patescibacteria group bacterium]
MKKFILKSSIKWVAAVVLSLILFLIIFSLCSFLYQNKYRNKIYPGVKNGSLDLSGKTVSEAEREIQKIVDAICENGFSFSFENIEIPISPVLTSTTDPSLVKEILSYDVAGMAKQAYLIGRNEKIVAYNFLKQLRLLANQEIFLPSYSLNQEELLNILKDNFTEYEQPAMDAKILIDDNNVITIEEEKNGYAFDYSSGIVELTKKLDKFNGQKIKIPLKKITDTPDIKKVDAMLAAQEARNLLTLDSISLAYQNNTWLIDKNLIKNSIILKNPTEADSNAISTTVSDGEEEKKLKFITLSKEKIITYLKEKIASAIDIEPLNAKFEIKDGRVIKFQGSKDGVKLDLEQTYNLIIKKIANIQGEKIELIVNEIKAEITTDTTNNLGIKEIIGIGKSNFSGSPRNRIHNIKTGADMLNGILIEPEENFSLITALGEIDAEHGYLPELVIKGNKTIPEYGGGLCQIGTTLFRSALDSGLPITERRNHSYRVSYYEPAGTDATIYNPKPDMRFINDTKHKILIQTKIEGNDLIFEFWGEKDGRIIEKTESKIFNIVKPLPTKFIETEDLDVGAKKCTEHAHNGADAEFDYKVTYSDGEIKEETFKSHYKPWREICLIGVEKIETASSTDEITAE